MSALWPQIRLGATYEVRDQRAGAESEWLPLMSVSQSFGVVPRSKLVGDQGRAENLANYKICEPGDIVLNRMSAYNGALGVARERGVVSPDYLVMTPRRNVRPEFIAAWLKTPVGVFEMTSRLRGIGSVDAALVRTPRVNESDLKTISLALPPLEEQRAIADYLDRETARIDTLIEEQQRLIEMLRERRLSALIDAFASMRAEAPRVPREPIPWLPQLVVEQAQMRHLCTIGTGSSDSANAVDEGYPFFVRGDQPLALDTYEFDTEAIITAGDGAMVGRSFHHFRGKFAAHQRVYVLRDFRGVLPRYLYWYFSTFFIRVVGDGGAQATVPSVRRPMIAAMPVPIPELDEQRRIAEYLDEQTAKIDALTAEAERFIELARERRSALITAAVTGQIDVREGA